MEEIKPALTKKSTRKRTKITVAIVTLIALSSVTGLYAYSYHVVNNALAASVETIKVDHVSIEAFSMSPPSLDIKIVFSIRNPTRVSVTLESISMSIFVDGSSAGVITVETLDLPANGKTTFEGVLHFTKELLQIVENEEYVMSMDGKIVGSARYLFVTITREYPVSIEETVTKLHN